MQCTRTWRTLSCRKRHLSLSLLPWCAFRNIIIINYAIIAKSALSLAPISPYLCELILIIRLCAGVKSAFSKKKYFVLVCICIYPNYCHEDDIKKNDEAAAKQFMGVFSKFSIKGNLCNLSLSAIGRGLGLGRCPLTRQIQTSMDKDVISDSGRISAPFCNMESLQCTGYEHFQILILLKVVALAFVGT